MRHLEINNHIRQLTIVLFFCSFLIVYSTNSYFVYKYGMSAELSMLPHLGHILSGILIILLVQRLDFSKIRKYSPVFLVAVMVLLMYTLLQGETIQGANASRWIKVFSIVSFQPSTLAPIVLIIYLAHMIGKISDNNIQLHFKHRDFLKIMGAILGICGLIFPANLSTALMIGLIAILVLLIGNISKRMILSMVLLGFILAASFIGLAMVKPDLFPSRVNTWVNRADSFMDSKENYQSLRAKNAIANGGILGKGAGKSMYKNELPQSSSDYIFSILVEEFGILGGIFVIILYTCLFIKVLIVANLIIHPVAKLTVIGLILWITTQAFVNIGVAEGLIPTTGQTLPLISKGGSSIWMTSLAIGLILSISRKESKKIAQ